MCNCSVGTSLNVTGNRVFPVLSNLNPLFVAGSAALLALQAGLVLAPPIKAQASMLVAIAQVAVTALLLAAALFGPRSQRS
jgi:hypothetical protein